MSINNMLFLLFLLVFISGCYEQLSGDDFEIKSVRYISYDAKDSSSGSIELLIDSKVTELPVTVFDESTENREKWLVCSNKCYKKGECVINSCGLADGGKAISNFVIEKTDSEHNLKVCINFEKNICKKITLPPAFIELTCAETTKITVNPKSTEEELTRDTLIPISSDMIYYMYHYTNKEINCTNKQGKTTVNCYRSNTQLENFSCKWNKE